MQKHSHICTCSMFKNLPSDCPCDLRVCSVLNSTYMQRTSYWSGHDTNTCLVFLERGLFLIVEGPEQPLQPWFGISGLQMSRRQEILKAKRATIIFFQLRLPPTEPASQSSASPCNCSSSSQSSDLEIRWRSVTAHNAAIQLVKPYSHVNQWSVHESRPAQCMYQWLKMNNQFLLQNE